MAGSTPLNGVDSAKAAGLNYRSDQSRGILRERRRTKFVYRNSAGQVVRDPATLKRIGALVLPPAWVDVWISPDPRSHLQATGRDAARRKQYRYHPSWTSERDSTKFHRMLDFADVLPAIRHAVARDLRGPARSRARVLATVVRLLERTYIRIGNEEYARANGSHGLTTLRGRPVSIRGPRMRFRFRAKSGVLQTVDVHDARLARAVRECQELPGQTVFQYVSDDGSVKSVTSSDVNQYLQSVAGGPFTAKDFRTWAGTLEAAQALDRLGAAPTKTAADRTIVAAIDQVAAALGNTRAVCRKCYIHPAVIDAYRAGLTVGHVPGARPRCPEGLRRAEACLVVLLRRPSLRKAA
jgi:DNA topoisomerase-1